MAKELGSPTSASLDVLVESPILTSGPKVQRNLVYKNRQTSAKDSSARCESSQQLQQLQQLLLQLNGDGLRSSAGTDVFARVGHCLLEENFARRETHLHILLAGR